MRFGFVAVLTALAFAPAASAAEWNAGGGAAWDQLVAEARQEGTLVLAACPEMAGWVGPAFKADTGIDISFIAGDLADVGNRFKLELETGNVTIDIRLGGSGDITAANDGKLKSLPELLVLPDVTDPQNWTDGHIQYMDDEQRYLAIGSEYLSSQPLINADIIDAGELQTLDDLLKPELKGKITGGDPAVAGGGQSIASYYAYLRGLDFIRDLYKDQEVVLSRDTRQLLEWAARGTYPIVLGLEVSVLQRFREAGIESLRMVPLKDAPGTTVGGCTIVSTPALAPHPESAQLFLNWYLSHAGQQALETALHLPSRRTDLAHEEVPASILLQPGVDYVATYREDWYLNQRMPLRAGITQIFGQ
jgi:ABC-type Fe3+ transport system substrate-binding protein